MKRSIRGLTRYTLPSKEFIRINDAKELVIFDCEFESKYATHNISEKCIGINIYNGINISVDECVFTTLYKGVNFVSTNGLLNDIKITANTFYYTQEPIRVFNSKTCIIGNTITLPSYSDVIPNINATGIGIYTHGSVVKILDNSVTTESADEGYGTVVRNSKLKFESLIQRNNYENLRFGSQFEGYNKKLTVRCNNYSNISSNAWSVNPFYIGSNSFPSQGEFTDPRNNLTKRAGNLFYDRDLVGKPYNHIRSSVNFEYSAATVPYLSVPEYITSNVTVAQFTENNNLTCLDNPLTCSQNILSVSELNDLILNITDIDSLPIYNEYLIEKHLESDDINDVINFLITLSDTLDYRELLIGTYLNLGEYEAAYEVLVNNDVSTERNQDYFNYYSNLIERELNEIPKDSITSTELDMYNDIMNRSNDISDLIRAYLNFHCDSNYLMLPEQWEEEESRPVTNPNPIIIPKISEVKSLETKIFPNPVNNELKVQFFSDEYKYLDLIIVNTLGEIVGEFRNVPNQKINIVEVNNLPAGVYQIRFINSDTVISNHKLVIIH